MSLTFTVTAGAKEGAYAGEDGTFVATLSNIEGPITVTPKDGGEPWTKFEWTWDIDDAPQDASLVWSTTSTNTGPKSKWFGIVTALRGGKPPQVGEQIKADELLHRQALITVVRNQNGYTDVTAVTPMPTVRAGGRGARQQGDAGQPF